MKNFRKVLALVLVVATLLSFATMASADYKDQASIAANYELAVDVLTGFGIISGDETGNFRPNDEIDRDEVAKMVAVLCNGGEDIEAYYADACTFADTKATWAAGYVAYCYHTGIIDGRNATTFDPNASITGYEVAKMLLCVLGFDADEQGYVGKDWKVNVLRDARNFGLLDGLDKSFNLKNNIKRQEVAQMILTLLKKPVVVGVLSDNIVKVTNALYSNLGYSIKDLGQGELALMYGNVIVSKDTLFEVYGYGYDVIIDCFGRPYDKWFGTNTVSNKSWELVRPIAKGAALGEKTTQATYVFLNGEFVESAGKDVKVADLKTNLAKNGLVVETYNTGKGTVIAAFETDVAVVTATRKYQGVQQYQVRFADGTTTKEAWLKNTEGYTDGTILYATYCDNTEGVHGKKLSLSVRAAETADGELGVYFEKATPIVVKVTDVESTSKDAPAAWNKDNTVFFAGQTKYDYHEANYAGYYAGGQWNNTFFVATTGTTYNVYMNNGYAIAFTPYVAPDTATYGYAYFEGDEYFTVESDKKVNGNDPDETYYLNDMIDFTAKDNDEVKTDKTTAEFLAQYKDKGLLQQYKVANGVLTLVEGLPFYAQTIDVVNGEIGHNSAEIVNSTKILVKVAGKYEAHDWASLKAKYGAQLGSNNYNVQYFLNGNKVTYMFIEADWTTSEGYFFVVKWDRTRTSDQLPGGALKYVEQYSVVINGQAAKLWIDSDWFEIDATGTKKENLIAKLFDIKVLYLGNTIDGEAIYYVDEEDSLIEKSAFDFDHIDSGKVFWKNAAQENVVSHLATGYAITVFEYNKDGYVGTKLFTTADAFNAEFQDNQGYTYKYYAEKNAAGEVVNLFVVRTAL